jgi:hypothetical protein
MKSVLVKNQKVVKDFQINHARFNVEIQFDDECNNGHNTLSVTGRYLGTWGAMHTEMLNIPIIEKYVKRAIPFHGCHTDGPLHYIPNTLYWVGIKNYDFAMACAICDFPEDHVLYLSEEFFKTSDNETITRVLNERLPTVLEELKKVVESYGMVY